MATLEFGLFDGIGRAGRVVSALGACGFGPEDLSLVAYENEGRDLSRDPTVNSATCRTSQIRAFDDHLSQALLGAHTLPVGGIGSVLVTGPFALTLIQTRRAASAADLMAALTILQVLDADASYYAEAVRRGGSLVLVNAPLHMVDRAQDIMLLHNAVDRQQRVQRWRQQGWERFDPEGRPCTSEETTRERLQQANEYRGRRGFHLYDRDFRGHYYLTETHSTEPYEQYATAYHYGYKLVYDQEYRDKDWSTLEPRARRQWEQHAEQRWEAVVDAIYYGFTKGQEHHRSWIGGVSLSR